jgi:hypothetical protein
VTTRAPVTEEQIPLEAGIRDRLGRLSVLMGVPSATMAAHAIARWVAEQERSLALIESLGDPVGGEMGSRLREMLRTGLFRRQQELPGALELSEAEVGAIAERENLSTSAAAGLGSALLRSRQGIREIGRLVRESIEDAKAQGQSDKAKDLEGILDRFRNAQPLREGATGA